MVDIFVGSISDVFAQETFLLTYNVCECGNNGHFGEVIRRLHIGMINILEGLGTGALNLFYLIQGPCLEWMQSEIELRY